MKKLLLLLIIGLATVASLRIFVDGNPGSITPLPFFPSSSTPAPTPKPGSLITYNGETYRVHFVVVAPQDVSLYSNLDAKISARQLKEQKGCKSLINGGFYSKENTALGLLISDGYTQSDYRTNSLFNGIFGITYAEELFLGSNYPIGSTRVAIQSGPVLIKDTKVQTLQLKNDEHARRSVVGLIENGSGGNPDAIFFSIYKDGSQYDGPLLADLPEILNNFAKEHDIPLYSALNLDGGSASAFYTEGVSLQELTYIGSYFCIN